MYLSPETLDIPEIRIGGTSGGPIKLLRRTTSSTSVKGTWRDVGLAKEFTVNDKQKYVPFKLFCWPDTDDTLLQYCAKDAVPRCSNYKDFVRQIKRGKTRWETMEANEYDGYSFPTLCIHDLFRFMERQNGCDGFIGFADSPEDAVKVMIRASSILLPRPDAARFSVVHQFGPKREYRGFIVRAKNAPVERYNGMEIVDDVINLSLPYFMGVTDSDQMQLAVTCMMREYDRYKPRVWDDARCEEFFNDSANFISP